jgi:hypothetical protein
VCSTYNTFNYTSTDTADRKTWWQDPSVSQQRQCSNKAFLQT